MGNRLCRHCFRLFPDREVGVLCTSRACEAVRDGQGRLRPRFFVPRNVPPLWSALRRRPDFEAACPACGERGKLIAACPSCRHELPRVENGDDRIIAVIGAKNSGKSHYLAALFHQLLREGVGGDTWRAASDEATMREIERRYWRPLFEEMRELDETALEPGPELRLDLEHRASGRLVQLVFRDLSGESFARPERLDDLDFLHFAHGVVVLADPAAFGALPGTAADAPEAAYPDFVEVLDNYRRAIAARPRYGDPGEHLLPLEPERKLLAVAVSKADLALERSHPFWHPEDGNVHLEAGFWQRRAEASERAEGWLAERVGGRLARATEGFADVSYFFISNYGYEHRPRTETLRKPPEPLRVHEPIFALLDRFGLDGGGGGRRRVAAVGVGGGAGDSGAGPDELEEL